ncbi:MAG TPA: hypothetical protein VNA16_01085 [Abditibacteriaceae bacterium]|nr:hypothetical protein [Abditibacteriaceae bacterium]
MSIKLFLVSLASRLLYIAGGLAFVYSLWFSVMSRDFFWPGFLSALGLAFNGLLLDVLVEIGTRIASMEAEQSLIRAWVQQLRS